MQYAEYDLLSRTFKYELSDGNHTARNRLPLAAKFDLKPNFKSLVSDQSLIQLRS